MAMDPPSSPQSELRPRLCTMKKGANGYGFNLHSDKSKPGQFIRAVDPDSPAEASGLRAKDRIVEVVFLAFLPGSSFLTASPQISPSWGSLHTLCSSVSPWAQATHRCWIDGGGWGGYEGGQEGRKGGKMGDGWTDGRTEGLTPLLPPRPLGSSSPSRHTQWHVICPPVQRLGLPQSYPLPEAPMLGVGRRDERLPQG